MPEWVTWVLALGGSTLISLIINAIWRLGEAKIKHVKELEQKEAENKKLEEDRKHQEEWEQKIVNIITPIDKKIDNIQKDLTANKDATVSSLRADMMLLRDQFRAKGYASGNDKAAWNQLYDDYSNLGGNHFREYVDQWKIEVNRMNEEKPKKISKGE